MLWRTHLAFGLGVASLVTIDPILLILAGILSILPDLDAPFGHRSWFSHSLLAALIFSVVAFLASSSLLVAWLVLICFLIHILLDLFTKSGVPLFFPIGGNFGLRLVASKDKMMNKVFMVAGLLLLLVNIGGPEFLRLLK